MADTYTETTTRSWGSRLGSSFKGIFLGIALFIIGTGLLWWNEGRTVRSGDAIAEAHMVAEELTDISKIDPSFNGKLIHAIGAAKTTENITDNDFNITRQSISIRRKVEFYQWVESSSSKTEKKVGGGEQTVTTYSYDKKWVSAPVNSSSFKKSEGHENRVRANIDDKSIYANKVNFGAYTLSQSQISSISGSIPLTLKMDENALTNLQNNLFPTLDDRARNMVHVSNNTIYLGPTPDSPRIGDMRITFYEIPNNQTISIIAQIDGATFTQWKASNGETFSRLITKSASLDEMIQSAKEGNTIISWLLRILGIILVISGLSMILAPLSVIADVIPLLGNIIGFGTGLIAKLFGFAWSLIVIALAWIRFRPILGICLLGIAIVCIGLIFLRKKNKVKQNPTSQTA